MSIEQQIFDLLPDQSLEDFIRGFDFGRSEDVASVRRLLQSPSIPRDLERRLSDSLLGGHLRVHEFLAGAIAFCLFALHAERYRSEDDIGERDLANRYLCQPSLSQFLELEYRLNARAVGGLELHRVGTTSYILRSHHQVLKLVKYRYLGNARIAAATAAYQDAYGQLTEKDGTIKRSYSPQIYASGPGFVLMEYLEGPSLAEYMEQELVPVGASLTSEAERLRRIATIVTDICHGLSLYLRTRQHCHHDVSPSNIIIQVGRDGHPHAKLIDFGMNYILVENLGGTVPLDLTQPYFASELLRNVETADERADYYSVGILLLKMLVSPDGEFREPSYELDRLWREYPDLGPLVESLIAPRPEQRAIEMGTGILGYSRIVEVLESQIAIHLAGRMAASTGKGIIIGAIQLVLMGQLEPLSRLLGRFREIRRQGHKENEEGRLLAWGLTAQMCLMLIASFFAVLTANDLGFISALPFGEKIEPILPPSGQWRTNLPGRLVSLSFGLVAAHYYLNVFATIAARDVSKRVDSLMRLNAFVFAIPIMWALIYRPADWPLCSAIGVWVVAILNFASYKLAARGVRAFQVRQGHMPSMASKDVVDLLQTWAVLMGVYGLGLIILEVLLLLGVARDEWFYALIVALLINMLKMYRYNCSKQAGIIKGGLLRAVAALRGERLQRALMESGSRSEVSNERGSSMAPSMTPNI